MRLPRAALLAAPAALVLGLVVLPTPAEAAVRTSTGVRCTLVGTAGNDVLKGTRRSDVICGRGGNDRITGGAGTDLVDGGTGNDVVHGNAGNDRVYGGPGRDTAYGDDGADVLSGQTDSDLLVGGTGNDRISGGDGNDVGLGNDGADVVNGDAHNDDLQGGPGTDTVNGGSGTNWCDVPAGDRQTACTPDRQAPQVHEIVLTRSTVDVSAGPVTVTASVHVTDDTGVRQVQVGQVATLVRGTVRDGWWSVAMTVPRYTVPGPREIDVHVTDRVGRYGARFFPDALTVQNSVYDRTPPVLQSLTLAPSTVDVRTVGQVVTATARITDDLAGAGTAYLCPAHLFADAYRQSDGCETLTRVSGTARDGVWKASYTVPRGAVGGRWNFQVWLDDASGNHPTQYYFGSDQLQWEAAHDVAPWGLPVPGGGAFTVIGSSDNNAPSLTSVRLLPASVDTRSGAVEVTAEVAATDAEGVSGVSLFVSGEAADGGQVEVVSSSDAELVQGTSQDGVWRIRFTVPGGTPAGSYPMQVVLEDATHFESWFTPGSPYGAVRELTPAQTPSGDRLTVQ